MQRVCYIIAAAAEWKPVPLRYIYNITIIIIIIIIVNCYFFSSRSRGHGSFFIFLPAIPSPLRLLRRGQCLRHYATFAYRCCYHRLYPSTCVPTRIPRLSSVIAPTRRAYPYHILCVYIRLVIVREIRLGSLADTHAQDMPIVKFKTLPLGTSLRSRARICHDRRDKSPRLFFNPRRESNPSPPPHTRTSIRRRPSRLCVDIVRYTYTMGSREI